MKKKMRKIRRKESMKKRKSRIICYHCRADARPEQGGDDLKQGGDEIHARNHARPKERERRTF